MNVVDKIMLMAGGNIALFGKRDEVLAKLNGQQRTPPPTVADAAGGGTRRMSPPTGEGERND
jgi:ABC-type protease/lipase transport system fused ATPase/permease subunit